ncbi:Vesicle-fusing ATPase [Galdieria sulphuraria]|nr:Vesicle-fusing ATPase [Galdieria sulphuraria]
MTSWFSSGLNLTVVSCPSQDLAKTNKVFLSPKDFEWLYKQYPQSFESVQVQKTQYPETVDSLEDGVKSSLVSCCLVDLNGAYCYLASEEPMVSTGSIGLNSIQRRENQLALGDSVKVNPRKTLEFAHIVSASIEVDLVSKTKVSYLEQVNAEDLSAQMLKRFTGVILSRGQSVILDFFGVSLLLKVNNMQVLEPQKLRHVSKEISQDALIPEESSVGLVTADTTLFFSKAAGSSLRVIGGDKRPKDIFKPDFNFEKMGIGGLDKEFSDIFRRAFASRVFPPSVIKKLGIQHVKGMLLYGPPGTGKTLIARQIGKMLNGKEPKVVNGPEILNKYVGQSEENIRNLFKEAEAEYRERLDDSELHIIIFDEIDAICKHRGNVRDGTGVHDTVVNQLLSKIDGVNALNNILVIGMTNRKDMIDEALLRPGRLEVHVEISLPDERGRLQILHIHTNEMRKNGKLAADVSLEELASRTKNFSGAEIEGLCKSAAAYALNRHIDLNNLRKQVNPDDIVVTMEDFENALLEIEPAFGMPKEHFERCLFGGFYIFSERMEHLVKAGNLFCEQEQERRRLHPSPEEYVGFSEASKCNAIAKVFDDAHKSPLSCIVIDNIERLIEFAPIGPRFSNTILQTLLVLIKQVPPKGRRLLILATCSMPEIMESLDVRSAFHSVLSTSYLQREEIIQLLKGHIEDATPAKLYASEPQRQSNRQRRRLFLQKFSGIGIKKFLMVMEMMMFLRILVKSIVLAFFRHPTKNFRFKCSQSTNSCWKTVHNIPKRLHHLSR